MLKLLQSLALLVALVLSTTSFAQATWDGSTATNYAGGSGSSDAPFLISNASQLAKLAQDVNNGNNWSQGKFFQLTEDIILNENVLKTDNTPNSGNFRNWIMIGYFNSEDDYQAFSGVLDGNGFSIKGIYINDLTINYLGLFRYLENATVKNLGIEDSYIYGNANIGGVVGIASNSRIINCYNTGRVDGSGSYHGGIAGVTTQNTLVANCYNLGYISGKNNTSGIVARNGINADVATVENCYNVGSINASKANKAGITAENNEGCSVNHSFFLDQRSIAGVFLGKGSTSVVESKTDEALKSADFITTLNERSKNIPLACQWAIDAGYPQHNYTEFTPDNQADVSAIATGPHPSDGDEHAPSDNGSITLRWKPAVNGKTVRHFLYFTSSESEISGISASDTTKSMASLSLKDTTYTVSNVNGLPTYYWRVDQLDSDGIITQGEVWKFRVGQLAFRGAEGYGRHAIGGRGGQVIEVTSLEDRGPGTLRDALTNHTGPRTIVFSVSGIIKLQSRILMHDKYVTIAGQTAPGKGICIRSAPMGLGDDYVVRFIRLRLGAGPTYDGMGMPGSNHSIIDHCSISWTIDEGVSTRAANNITFQHNMIAEALNVAGHDDKPAGAAHGYAGSIGGDIGSFHHNLLAHNEGRNWSMAGGLDANADYAGRLDIFNNVVYNWNRRTTDGGAHEVNFVNNYYKAGAATNLMNMITADLEGMGNGSQSYYVTGNILENPNGSLRCDGTDINCGRKMTVASNQVVDWEVWRDKPFFPSYAKIESAEDAYKSVLSNVGATQPVFDDHDKRIVQETLTGTFKYRGSKTRIPGLPDHHDDVGGYEHYPMLERHTDFDTDHDGLPNWWETLHGSDINSTEGDFSDANADANSDGYTAMEDYLEWMSVQHYHIAGTDDLKLDLAPLAVGYTDAPVFKLVGDANAVSIALEGSNATISAKPGAKGIFYLTMTVTDSEGSTMDRRIGVSLGAESLPTDILLEEFEPQLNTELLHATTIYPNPFENELILDLNIKNDGSYHLFLSDLSGKKVFNTAITIKNGRFHEALKMPNNLPAQLYILNVVDPSSGQVYVSERIMKR